MNQNFIPINLDIYEFFVMYAKKAKEHSFDYADTWLKSLLSVIKGEAHIKQGQMFCYDIEKDGWYNWFSPYHRINKKESLENKGKYELKKDDNFYFIALTSFLATAAKKRYLFIPIFFPRYYGERPFLENVNDVHGYLDDKGWAFQQRFIKKAMRKWKNAYKNRVLWAKPTNEIGHSGDWSKGVEIAWWFEEIYSWIDDKVRLNRLIMDTSHSDFNKLCDQYVLPTHGRMIPLDTYKAMPDSLKPPIKMVKGRPGVFPSKAYPRKGWPEAPHGVNQWSLFEPSEGEPGQTLWEAYQSPSWRHHSLSGDANSRGSGYVIPGQNTFKELSAEELYEYYYFIFKYRADHPHSAKLLMGLFPMHIFVREEDTGYIHGDLQWLNYTWLKQPWKAWCAAGKPRLY